MNDAATLAAALRALPASSPPTAAWPALATRLHRRRAARQAAWFALPAACAAALVLALAWPQLPWRTARPAVASVAAANHAAANVGATVATLQASSSQWQAWTQQLDRQGAPLDGPTLAAAVALQDRIGLIDLQLSAARNPDTAANLWRQRIALLQQLGLLHLQPQLLAEQAHGDANHLISL